MTFWIFSRPIVWTSHDVMSCCLVGHLRLHLENLTLSTDWTCPISGSTGLQANHLTLSCISAKPYPARSLQLWCRSREFLTLADDIFFYSTTVGIWIPIDTSGGFWRAQSYTGGYNICIFAYALLMARRALEIFYLWRVDQYVFDSCLSVFQLFASDLSFLLADWRHVRHDSPRSRQSIPRRRRTEEQRLGIQNGRPIARNRRQTYHLSSPPTYTNIVASTTKRSTTSLERWIRQETRNQTWHQNWYDPRNWCQHHNPPLFVALAFRVHVTD